MPEPEGKLRERLTRIENSLADALTRLGKLQQAHDASPTPATAERIEVLQATITEMKTLLSTLSQKGNVDADTKESSLWYFLFGDEETSQPSGNDGSSGQ